MKKIILILACCMLGCAFKAQMLTQTVRGTIKDVDSEIPLIGAGVLILDTDPPVSAMSDVNGNFKLTEVPIGRINLRVTYVGYETKTLSNVVVDSGREVVLDLSLQESIIDLEEIVVKATKNNGEALNDMALISARSISAEETNRYAGGFNDPSKITANFAGVGNALDGGNDIIVRGNSPKYVQWRLEGMEIFNPNHFGDQSAVGGSISTLNNNILATSDFYTGAFSPEYGDALSGIYDVKLRSGNNEKFQSTFSFGLLGTDLTFEGPIAKDYGGSYLLNYRYSTASIISDLDLIDIGGIPKFQDAAFKVNLPTKNLGSFSLFGLWGSSSFLIEDVKPEIWVTPGDNSFVGNIIEDYDKGANLLNLGLNHVLPINTKSYLKTTLAFASQGIDDEIMESTVFKEYDQNGELLEQTVISSKLNFQNNLDRSIGRVSLTYNNKINPKHKLQVGVKLSNISYDFSQSQLRDTTDERVTLVDFTENIQTIRNFVSWRYRVNERLTFVTGIHNVNVLLNNKNTFEARVAANYKLNDRNKLTFGFGQHSTMESIHNYFTEIEDENGNSIRPNEDLDLLKADHFVLGYERIIGVNTLFKTELYYQRLYDIPVENSTISTFSTLNEGLDFMYVDLVNEGTGRNYGLEMTLERSFKKNYYFMVNGSLFQSKYTTLEDVERDTQFSGDYIVNILLGKEYTNWGSKENQSLGLNAKLFLGGGKKIIPLLRDDNGDLAVDPEAGLFFDDSKAYENKLEDVHLLVLSANYKWNKPKATHEINLNLDNVTNTMGKLKEYYDEDEPDNIGYVTQFGFFPNLLYRVYF